MLRAGRSIFAKTTVLHEDSSNEQFPTVYIVPCACFRFHAKDYFCPGCSAHQLLIYRDPGHLARAEAAAWLAFTAWL